MRSLEQRARARLGELIHGFELEWIEDVDSLSARFTARGPNGLASVVVLHDQLQHLPGFASGFGRAAWLTTTLNHPCVPRVLHSGSTATGVPYVVLDHIGGETLQTYLERRSGTVPPSEALRIVGELGDALSVAEKARLIHGAIHPQSVALREDGSVRLLNFGWSRLREQAAAHLGTDDTTEAAAYMSPGQARGDVPTTADDLWSVGAMLFELLSGRPLRLGANPQEVATLAAMEPAPSLASVVPNVPAQFTQLLDGALNREPGLRPTPEVFATKCRALGESPAVLALRNLSPVERVAIVEAEDDAVSVRDEAPPHQSQVSAMQLPPTGATGTLSPAGPAPAGRRHSLGAYSSRGASEELRRRSSKKL